MARDGCLDDLPMFDRPGVVRMESPGKDDRVTRLLLEAGGRDDQSEPPRDWRGLEIPKGLIVRPGLLYRGFRRVLGGLRRAFDARPHLAPTACPLAVAEMFDKTATAKKIEAAGVPTPERLPSHSDHTSYTASILNSPWPVTYAKLNTGSSATGIVVVYRRGNGGPAGVTSLAEIGGEFYNSRLIRPLDTGTLVPPVAYLCREGIFVQRGIPMAQIDGQNFDVRVVCVYGQPVATIFRLSSFPMTNLHLGGRRGDFTSCRATVPTRDWLDALDHSAEAAGCFDSAIAGVDLLFERGYRRHYVLEVNAFGDFFPGWTDPQGRSVHALEIAATARRFG